MDAAIQAVVAALVPLIVDYLFPALLINIIVDAFKAGFPKAPGMLWRVLVLVLALGAAAFCKAVDHAALSDMLTQGAVVAVLAILAYDTRLYPWVRDLIIRAKRRK